MNYKLIAYSLDFVSFLLQKCKFQDNINNIILFGSVSRGDEEKESDIDIFIDIKNEEKKINENFKKCLSDFYSSTKYKNYWNILGVNNQINIIVGALDKWKDLKPNIIGNGVCLYGKFKSEIKEGFHKVMFNWENIKPNSKRVLLNKKIFGYKKNKKFYLGLIHKYNCERMGKGCIVIPLEYYNLFYKIFKNYKVTVKTKRFLEY